MYRTIVAFLCNLGLIESEEQLQLKVDEKVDKFVRDEVRNFCEEISLNKTKMPDDWCADGNVFHRMIKEIKTCSPCVRVRLSSLTSMIKRYYEDHEAFRAPWLTAITLACRTEIMISVSPKTLWMSLPECHEHANATLGLNVDQKRQTLLDDVTSHVKNFLNTRAINDVRESSEIKLTKIEHDKLAADVAYYHYADSAFFDQLFPVVFGICARLNGTPV